MRPGTSKRCSLAGKGRNVLGILLTGILTAQIVISPASARPNIVTKEYDYAQIGAYDEKLSKLCANKLFNQASQFRVSAYFVKNKVLLGGAKGTGWNLRDPTRARRYHLDYWFRNDGFSDCEVFIAVSKRKPPTDKRAAGKRR